MIAIAIVIAIAIAIAIAVETFRPSKFPPKIFLNFDLKNISNKFFFHQKPFLTFKLL